ncbi:molybdopterin synthase catalytic subunit MoaE [Glaciecola sp. 1036]|uniref:molybdopterin synthase catalytic subunit MoaE n=1 Tax=Alteromonadaceae TaxID=72275 RepID=UPI003CFC4958
MIKIQQIDFDVGVEYNKLTDANPTDGAVVFFVGLVRDFNQGHEITGMTLEHYPQMAEKQLAAIVDEAKSKWQLGRVSVIHRVGNLQVNDQIVFVGVSSQHREQAFQAASYIMDYLKTRVPIWKKETTNQGTRWVEAGIKS